MLVKPSSFLFSSGKVHGTGRGLSGGGELNAQKVKAALKAADKGFVGVLLEAEGGEHLVHDADGPAEFPAWTRKDTPIMQEAGVVDFK